MMQSPYTKQYLSYVSDPVIRKKQQTGILYCARIPNMQIMLQIINVNLVL